MNEFGKIFPWIVVVLGGAMFMWAARPAADDGIMKVHEFGKLPVVDGGRVKPYETLARDSLMMISGRQSFEDEAGNRQPAIRWLLDAVARPWEANNHRVFRIENEQVLDMLGLEARSGFRYALDEFNSDRNLRQIQAEARRANEKDQAQRDAFDNQVMQLFRRMQLYNRLVISHEIPQIADGGDVQRVIQRYRAFTDSPLPHAVPPRPGSDEEWKPFMRAVLETLVVEDPNPAVGQLGRILIAYAQADAPSFNEEVAAYRARLGTTMPADLAKAGVESWFKGFAPFYHSAVLYLVVFLLCCLAWFGWAGPLNKAAFALAALILVVHTAALGVRMYLDGRPPVTNLYGSAIFVGWGCVMLGLILEWFFRNGLGVLVASVTGFMSLIVAHNLAADGSDTLGVLVAVLDTNFWLATHVTTMTLGYTATFIAGFLGIVYVLRGMFTRSLTPDARKQISKMIYGTVCFALLLSFVGTVLGGIWADQSWGRFWGWDPKENGALIIVLWNALILHARWGGMVQQRGIAVLAIFGNIVVTWSWFGVNELGAGLHSYGFTDGTLFWLSTFVLSQLAIIAVGSLPLSMWRSYTAPKLPPEPEQRPGRNTRVSPAN